MNLESSASSVLLKRSTMPSDWGCSGVVHLLSNPSSRHISPKVADSKFLPWSVYRGTPKGRPPPWEGYPWWWGGTYYQPLSLVRDPLHQYQASPWELLHCTEPSLLRCILEVLFWRHRGRKSCTSSGHLGGSCTSRTFLWFCQGFLPFQSVLVLLCTILYTLLCTVCYALLSTAI